MADSPSSSSLKTEVPSDASEKKMSKFDFEKRPKEPSTESLDGSTEASGYNTISEDVKGKEEGKKDVVLPIRLDKGEIQGDLWLVNLPPSPPYLLLSHSTNTNYEQKINALSQEISVLWRRLLFLENTFAYKERELRKMEKTLEEKEEEMLRKNYEINVVKIFKASQKMEIENYKEYLERSKKENNDDINNNKDYFDRLHLLYAPESKSIDYSHILTNLQKDLLDFDKYINILLRGRKAAIKSIISEVQAAVNEISHYYTVNLYGSYATGLCIPSSDVDLVITYNGNDIENENLTLEELANVLKNKEWVTSQKLINSAHIPLIKLVLSPYFYSLNVDISLCSRSHLGLSSVSLVQKFMYNYPFLHPVLLALKTTLELAHLNRPFEGGLSSYGLVLMAVSFVENVIERRNRGEECREAIIFLEFLEYYGLRFNYKSTPIFCNISSFNNIINNPYYNNKNGFVIVDPLNNNNNVAKSTFNFERIKTLFSLSYLSAFEDCGCFCFNSKDFQNDRKSTEICVLKRVFNVARTNTNNFVYNNNMF